jgi:HlyD family secretion protein
MFHSHQTTQNLAAFYLAKQKSGSVIYVLVLFAFTVGIAVLPFINIAITFQSRGQIRPVTESNIIAASLPVKVKTVNITENQTIQKGAIVLVLNTDKLQEQIQLNQTQLTEKRNFITDLTELTQSKYNCKVKTLVYQKELQQYREQLQGLNSKQHYFKQEYNRSTKLYRKGVIAVIEYEQKKYDYKNSVTALANFKNNQLSKWQNTLQQFFQDTVNLNSQIQQLKEDKKQYIITAPITGTIKNYSGIKAGNFVIPNQTIAEISPNDNLIVECYASPKELVIPTTQL